MSISAKEGGQGEEERRNSNKTREKWMGEGGRGMGRGGVGEGMLRACVYLMMVTVPRIKLMVAMTRVMMTI